MILVIKTILIIAFFVFPTIYGVVRIYKDQIFNFDFEDNFFSFIVGFGSAFAISTVLLVLTIGALAILTF